MSSTNKTTNYELSQYIGSDKPTYLGDYNSDMLKIDTGIHTAQSKADEIGTLSNLTTDSKTNLVSAINEVDFHTDSNTTDITSNTSHIGTMTNLDTTVKTDLVNAINEVKTEADTNKLNIEKINLTSYTDLTVKSLQNINSLTTFSVKIATNTDNSLYKLYGYISYTHGATEGECTIICDTPLRPEAEYTVANCLIALNVGSGLTILSTNSFKVKTNGEIEIKIFGLANSKTNVTLPGSIYFNKSFGDVSN